MNSAQRRKAFRALPKPGTVALLKTRKYDEPRSVVVVGVTCPTGWFARPAACMYAGDRPSVHRVKVQFTDGITSSFISPLAKRLQPSRAAA
jgi:hypothetical protein